MEEVNSVVSKWDLWHGETGNDVPAKIGKRLKRSLRAAERRQRIAAAKSGTRQGNSSQEG